MREWECACICIYTYSMYMVGYGFCWLVLGIKPQRWNVFLKSEYCIRETAPKTWLPLSGEMVNVVKVKFI